MAGRESANIQVGILTASDSCYNGTATDRSGENLKLLVESGKYIKATVVTKDILPDEFEQIKSKLLHWSDHLKLDLILTTGGTGFSLRDVTPEATKAVLEREAPGMVVAMLKGSLDITPLAMLTRLACGTRGRTLIINLPGSMKGSAECFQIASTGIPHAVDLLRGHKQGVDKTHSALQSEGIKSAYINQPNQLNFPYTQPHVAETVQSTGSLPIPGTTVTSGYPSACQTQLNPDFSQPSRGSAKSRAPAAASLGKPAKNFTSELPASLPTTMAPSTLQFWRTLFSLPEATRINLMNSLLPVVASSSSAVTTTDVIPSMASGTPSVISISTASSSQHCNTEPHSVPSSRAGKISPSTSTGPNSYANMHTISAFAQNSVMQPRNTHSSFSQLNTAPSSTSAAMPTFSQPNITPSSSNTSTAMSREQWADSMSVSSLPYSRTTSKPNATTKAQSVFPNSLHPHPMFETVDETCTWPNSVSGLNMSTVEMTRTSDSLSRTPVYTDSIKGINTSASAPGMTASTYRHQTACYNTAKDRPNNSIPFPDRSTISSNYLSTSTQNISRDEDNHNFYHSHISRNEHPPNSSHSHISRNEDTLNSSHSHISRNEDTLNSSHSHISRNEHAPTSSHSHISRNEDTLNSSYSHNLMNSLHENIVSRGTAIFLPDNNAGNHDTVCTREIKPGQDCAGNPLVQIFLPCSQHPYQDSQTAWTKPLSSTGTTKKNILKNKVKKNRTRILNILRRQNKGSSNGKTGAEQVVMIPDRSAARGTSYSNARGEAVNTRATAGVESDSTVSSDHTYMHYNISEHLEEISQMGDVAGSQKLTETSGDSEICCNDGLSGQCWRTHASVVSSTTGRSQDDIKWSGGSELFYKIKDSSKLHKECELQYGEESTQNLSEMPASQRCLISQSTQGSSSSSPALVKWSTAPTSGMMTIKSAKIHNVKQHGELLYVPVGESFKSFLREHPFIQGIYLHKGKREIKKQLAQMCRHCDVSDMMTTWRRGKEILERNCFDDYFELTEDGRREQKEVHSSKKRDQYVVNWYVWCPGHGNCRRRCGGFGACAAGCQGMQHKQDRHNCSMMINMKLFLSDLSTWRVNITGTHVPSESGMLWNPPLTRCKQNSSCSKGSNIKCSKMCCPKKEEVVHSDEPGLTEAESHSLDVWTFSDASDEALILPRTHGISLKTEADVKNKVVDNSTNIPTKKRISKMLSSLKRRREERLTTSKSTLFNSKSSFSLSHCLQGQTTHEYSLNKNRVTLASHTSAASCAGLFDNSDGFKQGGSHIQDADTIIADYEGMNNIETYHTTPGQTSAQHLSSELLNFLTADMSQGTTVNQLNTESYGPSFSDQNWALPSCDTKLLESSSESNSALDNMAAVFGSPQERNFETSSLFISSMFDSPESLGGLITAERDVQALEMNSSLQEDFLSKESTSHKCMDNLTDSEGDILLTESANFEQPFLSENTLGEILQQANRGCLYNSRTQTYSTISKNTGLSDITSVNSSKHTSQDKLEEQSHSLCQQPSSCELASIMQQLLSATKSVNLTCKTPMLQQLLSKVQPFLGPSTLAVSLDPFPETRILQPVPGTASPNTTLSSREAVPTVSHSSFATSDASSHTSSLPTLSPHFPHKAPHNIASESMASCYEDIPEHLQDDLQTEFLPSYEEATVALAEQLGLGQSDKHL